MTLMKWAQYVMIIVINIITVTIIIITSFSM